MELQRMGDVVGGGLGWRWLDEKAEDMIRLMMGQLSAHHSLYGVLRSGEAALPSTGRYLRSRYVPEGSPTNERKLREEASASSDNVAVVADSCIPHLGHTIPVHLV
ncbi:hypothetical protein PG988_005577 [Apiospora saccharicola]